MKCTNCGAEIDDNSKFCKECGKKVERRQLCPQCGAEVNGGRFCPECGAPLTNETPQADTYDNSNEDEQFDDLLKDFDGLAAAKKAQDEKTAEHGKKIRTARSYIIRGMYAEAKAIYDRFIDDDPDDMAAYMGYIRLATKNYTVYDGEEIEDNIRIAMQISGAEDLSQFDADYIAFDKKRNQYLAEEARKEKERKEREAKINAILNIGDYKDIGGGYITFGTYPKSKKADDITIGELCDEERGYYLGSDKLLYEVYNDEYYKVEPIKWKILSRGSEMFIVADDILDAHCFDGSSNNYANSEIRSWLNGEFYNKAFNDNQMSKIVTTTVDNSLASTCDSKNEYVCGNTSDKVFLLSRKEAGQHLNSNETRKRVPTEYAVARGAYQDTDNDNKYKRNGKGCGYWWLRSPYYNNSDGAQYVIDVGGFISYNYVFNSINGVVCALKFKP